MEFKFIFGEKLGTKEPRRYVVPADIEAEGLLAYLEFLPIGSGFENYTRHLELWNCEFVSRGSISPGKVHVLRLTDMRSTDAELGAKMTRLQERLEYRVNPQTEEVIIRSVRQRG